MTIKIAVFTGTRAEYGLMKTLIKNLHNDINFELYLLISGTHFNKKFGETINEIINDFIKNDHIIPIHIDNKINNMGLKTAEIIKLMTSVLEDLDPEYLMILGDRFESFGAATAAHILGVKNIHIHGGETSLGAIDEKLRHAISQLSSYHFTSAEIHKNKVKNMIGSSAKVFNIGPMAIDGLLNLKKISKNAFEKKVEFIFAERNFLITFHSETLSLDYGIMGLSNLLKVLEKYNCKVLFTAPNEDKGHEEILKLIKTYVDRNPRKFSYIPSLGQEMYLNALFLFDCVIGNSSSGIIEAPLIKTKVINIGDRQKGRYKFGQVIDTPSDFESISYVIRELFDNKNEPKLNYVDFKKKYHKNSPSNQIMNILKNFLNL